MSEKQSRKFAKSKRERTEPSVSAVMKSGEIIELVYDQRKQETAFAKWHDGDWEIIDHAIDRNQILRPYSADNNLIRNQVVLFPSKPVEYGTQKKLIKDIRDYVHRHVDLSDTFELIVSYYALFSWLYDDFNELSYLRVKGNYGTGKTRFLQIVGSICYRPIFASGASTVSPIFHMLDMFGGTLIVDEADFRYSDEKADMAKILNCGNIRNIPVLRAQAKRDREFEPRVFQVFGPKIVATRGNFDDPALESRFITEVTKTRKIREDIPINLSLDYEQEALQLRNKLLLYRFMNLGKHSPSNDLMDGSVGYRYSQITAPLLAIIKDRKERNEIRHSLCQFRSSTKSGSDNARHSGKS